MTLLDQGVLEAQGEAVDAASTGAEAEVVLTEERAVEEVVLAASVAGDMEVVREALVVVVGVDTAIAVVTRAAAEEEEAGAGVGWMEEMEVMVVVLTGGVAVMVAAVVVAMVVASLVAMRVAVVVVAVEGAASRMPTASRSRTTKVPHP